MRSSCILRGFHSEPRCGVGPAGSAAAGVAPGCVWGAQPGRAGTRGARPGGAPGCRGGCPPSGPEAERDIQPAPIPLPDPIPAVIPAGMCLGRGEGWERHWDSSGCPVWGQGWERCSWAKPADTGSEGVSSSVREEWGDLIIGFHIPETLPALRVGPLHHGKHPRCPGEEEAPERHRICQTQLAWFVLPFPGMLGMRLPRGNVQRLLLDLGPVCPGLAEDPRIFHKQLESHPRTSKPGRDSPKASIALDQRDSHTLAVHTKQGIR